MTTNATETRKAIDNVVAALVEAAAERLGSEGVRREGLSAALVAMGMMAADAVVERGTRG